MRFLDLISLPLAAFAQQKVRTLLTTLGVVFGSFVLATCLSIGQGVQDTIERASRRNDWLRKIYVGPRWKPDSQAADGKQIEIPGQLSEERKTRFQTEIELRRRLPSGTQTELNRGKLDELADLSHVESVVPITEAFGYTVLADRSHSAYMRSSQPENADGRRRIVAGRYLESSDEHSAVVSEYLLYRMGLINDADLDGSVGRKIRFELRSESRQSGFGLYLIKPDAPGVTRDEEAVLDKIKGQLPAIIPTLNLTPADLLVLNNALQLGPTPQVEPVFADFTIVGIQRSKTRAEENELFDSYMNRASDIVLPYNTAADLMFRVLGDEQKGLQQAVVIVDHEDHVKDVVQQITASGLQANAPLEHIERERLLFLIIFGGVTCVAGVALLVAALGIANTMLMSVLERTREIGIMKAVGAGNGILQLIFLVEGACIGLLGGSIGLFAAWGASFIGDAYVRSLVSMGLRIDPQETLFVFPLWIALVVITFAILVTTLAAVIPARRAARIDPAIALRHE
jgi:putative ABC transport system permease protein